MDSFDPYEAYSQYSPMGRNMGNPILNMLMMGAFGRNNYMPSLTGGENTYDAFLTQERSNQFMKLQGSSFANNMLFKRMGMQNHPAAHMMGSMAASPDSMIGKALFPMIGGNPMAASMQTYAKLSGANTMGNFGRLQAITGDETERVMQSLAENFYKTKKYEGPEGGREDIRKQTKEFLNERIAKKDYKYLEDVGFKVERDEEGKYTSKGLQEQADKFDLTAGKSQEQLIKESRQRTAGNISSQISKIMSTSDENASKAMLERLEKQVTAFNVMTKDQFKQTLNTSGLQGIRTLVQEFEKSGGVKDNAQSAEARKNISSEFGVYLDKMTTAPGKNKRQIGQDIETGLVAGGYATPEMIERIRGRDGIINAKDAANLVKQGRKFDTGVDKKMMEGIHSELNELARTAPPEPQSRTGPQRRDLKAKVAELRSDQFYSVTAPAELEDKLISSGVATPKEIQKSKTKYGSLTKQASEELIANFEKKEMQKLADLESQKTSGKPDQKETQALISSQREEVRAKTSALRKLAPEELEAKLISSGVATPEEIQKSKPKPGSLTKQASEELIANFEKKEMQKLAGAEAQKGVSPAIALKREEIKSKVADLRSDRFYSVTAPVELESKLISSGVATPEDVQRSKLKYGSLTKQASEELITNFEKRAVRKLDNIDELEQRDTKNAKEPRTRTEISESLIKTIHRKTYATEQEIRDAITDKSGIVDVDKTKEYLKKERVRKAVIGEELKTEAERIASPGIFRKAAEIFSGQASKQEAADILGKKLVSDKILTPEEFNQIKSEGGQFDQKKVQDLIASRRKEVKEKATALRTEMPAEELEAKLLSSGVATKEEIQKRKVKYGSLTREAGNELVTHFEERESNNLDRLSSDTPKTLFASKQPNKKEKTKTFLDKLQDRGLIAEDERSVYLDKNGELNEQAVKQLLVDKLGEGSSKEVTEKAKKIEKLYAKPIKELTELSKEPLSNAERSTSLLEKLRKSGVIGEEDYAQYVDDKGQIVRKNVNKTLEKLQEDNRKEFKAAGGGIFFDKSSDEDRAKYNARKKQLEQLEEETSDVSKAPKKAQREHTTEYLKKLVKKGVISTEEQAEYLDEQGQAKPGTARKLITKFKNASVPEEYRAEMAELTELQKAPQVAPKTYQKAVSESIKEKLTKNNLAGPEEIATLTDEDGNLNVTRTREYLKSVQKRKEETQSTLDTNIANLEKTPVGQTKKELQEQVRKKAVDSGIVTHKQWEDMLDESGDLNTEKFNKHRVEFEKRGAVIEADESAVAKNLSSRAMMKKTIASEISSDAVRMTEEKDTQAKKTLNDSLVVKLKETGGFSDEAIRKMTNEKTGLLDESKVKQSMESFSEMDKLEYLNYKSKQMQAAGKSYSGFNFENSRGFKLEDITSAYGKGAELRMLGDNRGMAPEDVMHGFSKYGTGTLSAARTVFGAGKTGAEYMEKMSNLVGGLDTNLSTQGGNEKMENLLRDVEATSRVAGVSIKTMLSIIESAQQLAADNPQLSTMSKSAITKMSLNAVQRATDVSRAMSSEDYRAAGGNQKMVAQEVQESLAFAQSPLGGTLAALSLRAKQDPKVYEWWMQQVKEGKATGRGLDDGLMGELADKLGVSVSDLAYSAANPEYAKRALKHSDISETIMGDAGKETVFNSFIGGDLYNVNRKAGETPEDFKKRLREEHNEFINKGGTEEQFLDKISENLTIEGSELLRSQEQTIRAGFVNFNRTDEQQAEMKNLVEKQRESSKALDKQFSAQRSPVVTQLMDAIMKKGKVSTDVIIDATTAAFATKDSMSDQRKKLTEEAKSAVENMGRNSGKTEKELVGTDEAPGEGLDALNKMVNLRKQLAQEAGEKGNADEAGLANRLEVLTAEDLEFTAKKAKHLRGSLQDNKELLANLEDRAAKGDTLTKSEDESLQALRNLRKIGAMEDESKFATAQKGGVGALVAAATESVFSANDKEKLEGLKKDRLEQLELDLKYQNEKEMETGGGLTSGMLEYYKDKGGVEQAAADYKERKGMFENEETREVYAKSKVGQKLAFTNEQISTDEEQVRKQSAERGEAANPMDKMSDNVGKSIKSMDELKGAVEDLKASIDSGGAVGDALGRLSSALTTGTSSVSQSFIGGSDGSW